VKLAGIFQWRELARARVSRVGGEPVFLERASGAYVYDTNGRRYIDYVGSWGPMVLGHAHPEVIRAVQESAALGLSFGAPTEIETQLAVESANSCPRSNWCEW